MGASLQDWAAIDSLAVVLDGHGHVIAFAKQQPCAAAICCQREPVTGSGRQGDAAHNSCELDSQYLMNWHEVGTSTVCASWNSTNAMRFGVDGRNMGGGEKVGSR